MRCGRVPTLTLHAGDPAPAMLAANELLILEAHPAPDGQSPPVFAPFFVNEPASLMCCDAGSLNFDDPKVRDAYIEARRHPDVRSAQAQLTAHYRQFWSG